MDVVRAGAGRQLDALEDAPRLRIDDRDRGRRPELLCDVELPPRKGEITRL
jgi:hypothetical protein